MKQIILCALWVISTKIYAMTAQERAIILNQELEFLMQEAPKPQIWARGNLPSMENRSGPTESMLPGVEDIEKRFFKDQVRMQSARSLDVEESTTPPKNRKKRSTGLTPRPDGGIDQDSF
jgi:hypothetical protein